MVSLRQIAANQRNATLSTGPTSPEGKARSRANAFKHGLAGDGTVIGDDERAALAACRESWTFSLRPLDEYERFLVDQIAVHTFRIQRCQDQEPAVRAYLSARAEHLWLEDRLVATEEVAVGLAKRPALVACRLNQSKYGCDWLLLRWTALGKIADDGGTWNEDQTALAFDMLGTPHELRDANPWEPGSSAAELAHQEIERLKADATGLLHMIDELDRDAALAGTHFPDRLSRELKHLQRYEAACHRRLTWAWDEFHKLRAAREGRIATTTASRALPELPPPTDEEYLARDRELMKPLLASLLRGEPLDPPFGDLTPDPLPTPAPAPSTPAKPWPMPDTPTFRLIEAALKGQPEVPMNRRQRRAAESRARRRDS